MKRVARLTIESKHCVQSSRYTASFGPGGLNAIIYVSIKRTTVLYGYGVDRIALQSTESCDLGTRVCHGKLGAIRSERAGRGAMLGKSEPVQAYLLHRHACKTF
jgi:hypothetical protein